MFFIFRCLYRLIYEFRHEIIILTLLLLVCSIPFWPLIFVHVGIHTNFFSNNFNLNIKKSTELNRGSWLIDLAKNLLGYASIFVPIYLISVYLHRIRYDEISGSGRLSKLIKKCLFESRKALPVVNSVTHGNDNSKSRFHSLGHLFSPTPGSFQYYSLMGASAMGLQISYLIWGVLQERIMTRSYDGEIFSDSQFLVFVNRLLAGLLAFAVLLVKESSNSVTHESYSAPLFKYSYASLSNILSSWCQYEALKFVSFPVQILAKASKIIPVMLMGKLVKKQSYRWDEYITAGIISMGVTLFLLDTSSHKSQSTHSQLIVYNPISGMVLLVCYMLFDSFTSNWQEMLFKAYKVNSFQMMAGVNIWSCFFTVASLIEQGTLIDSLSFGLRHWEFMKDAVIISVCSAFGQIFIFFTIEKFGAVVFIIIMTMRQAIAILLSCIIYGHSVHALGVLGISIVFLTLFFRIYLSFVAKIKNQSH